MIVFVLVVVPVFFSVSIKKIGWEKDLRGQDIRTSPKAWRQLDYNCRLLEGHSSSAKYFQKQQRVNGPLNTMTLDVVLAT